MKFGLIVVFALFSHVTAEFFSLAVGSAIVGGFGYLGYVREWHNLFKQCYGDEFEYRDIEQTLSSTFHKEMFGQHLAVPVLINAVLDHKRSTRPRKALTMALHGSSGTGKNFASAIIAETLFKKGMESKNVHLFSGNLHNDDPYFLQGYKHELFNWIKSNISACPNSLFIFDEFDKLPAQVIDIITPFVDANSKVGDVDPSKAIFLFLSNTGSQAIHIFTQKHYEEGKSRQDIPFIEVERLVETSAFNENGGFKLSELIKRHLVDHFVPFLPLTREHVMSCIKAFALKENFRLKQEEIEEIAESLVYIPKSNPIFSVSGCRQVESKTRVYRSNVRGF